MEQAVPLPYERFYSVEEYLEFESLSQEKHEYREGKVFAMAGGTETHNRIKMNIAVGLSNRLKDSNCRVHDSDMRLRVVAQARYTYPDVFVVCGERKYDPADPNRTTLTDPKLVVEVLSLSTETSDRGEKFSYYIQSPVLEDYLLVSQDRARVERFHRGSDGTWSMSFFDGIDAMVKLDSLRVELPLREIYDDVHWPTRA